MISTDLPDGWHPFPRWIAQGYHLSKNHRRNAHVCGTDELMWIHGQVDRLLLTVDAHVSEEDSPSD